MLDKELIRVVAARKSLDELRDMLLDVGAGMPEKDALKTVWEYYHVLCEVHIGDVYQTFSLQRKGDRERVKEWIQREYGDEPIPDYLLKPNTLAQIPDKALDHLIEHGYDKNTFEKLLTEEGKSMILLSWIEHITENDILNIRNESGRTVLSLRLKSGNISSYNYDEIMREIDEAKNANETRRNLANYYLTMSDEERRNIEEQFKESYAKTPEKEKELSIAIEEANINIKKLQKLEHLFWQTVEHWKAGLWRKPLPSLAGILEIPSQVAKKTIELMEAFSQDRGMENGKLPKAKKIKTTGEKDTDYIPKHRIVKRDVDKLLASMRLEKPETTLDDAKRLYGHQTKNSYSNINKAYHYKPKK